MNAPLTRQSGIFAATARFDALPEATRDTVRLGFTDALAVILAGCNEPVTQIVRDHAVAMGGAPDAPYLLGTGRVSAPQAALIDATAAHALDYDDYAFSNHMSAVLVPAAMAAAALSEADGQRMTTGYAVGYEVWADLMVREPDHLHSKGWHPTAVFGPVGAAACAAHVFGLDETKATAAIALSASHSGGLMANFGSMTKPYHAGRAAADGINAALLARAGLTAQSNALEDPRGLLAALSPSGNADLESMPQLGKTWRTATSGLNIKTHPTVGASQRSIDAILALLSETEVPGSAVLAIKPRVSKKHAAVMPFADPKSAAEAKFSLPFACAAALRFGKVGLGEVNDANLSDPEIRRLMAATTIDAVDDYDPDYPVAAPYDVVTLTLTDGRVVETPKIRRFVGHADAPLDEAGIRQKFMECAAYGGIDDVAAAALFTRVRDLHGLDGPGQLLLKE